MPAANQAPAPVIIKKVVKGGHGHHGGAWKVAYADFVTAMMAFFLLMWLINTTTPEQKRGIADFFAPASVSETTSGAGGLLSGQSLADAGARQAIETARTEGASRDGQIQGAVNPDQGETNAQGATLAQATAQADDAEFERAEQSIRQAIENQPELAELSKQVVMDITPEGLRIQLIDEEGRSMFAAGEARPNPRAEKLLSVVSQIVTELPNRISVSGHTDGSTPARGQSNWELSAQRANAARRILQANGVAGERVYQITGKADSDPLFPEDPDMPGNRRVAITLLRESPVLPRGAQP